MPTRPTARALGAEWQLTAESGIGLVRSFARSYNGGCGAHPGLAGQALIGNELTTSLRTLLGW